MIRPAARICAPHAPNDLFVRPEAVLRLAAGGDHDLAMLAEALADDLMAMVPDAMGVAIRLAQGGEEVRAARPPDGAENSSIFEVPILAYAGSAGEIALYMPIGCPLQAVHHHGMMWALTLASTLLDRRTISGMDRALGVADHKFETTFSHAPVGIAHITLDGSFVLVNDQFVAITGWSREELIEHGFQLITLPDDFATDLANGDRLISGQAARYTTEKRYIRPDGSFVWVNMTVALVQTADGQPDHFVSVIEDLSEVRRARAEATRDPLTGLLNRRGLRDRLRRELSRSAKTERPLTIVYLDLDDFKRINDEFGHARGDACLIAVARKLVEATRPGDTIARIGGDEFVLVLPDHELSNGLLIRRLTQALANTRIDTDRPILGSFGAVNTSRYTDSSAEMLIEAADRAMFRAKRAREKKVKV